MTKTDFEITKKEDLKNSDVPECMYWSCDQVCEFFEHRLNLPEYKQTLQSNCIDGRRLIYLDSTHLPKLGIQDMKHILLITDHIRKLLKIKKPYWNTSIADVPRDELDLYLEAKSVNGDKSDNLTYNEFKKSTAGAKWQAPLTNQGLVMPSY